MKRSLFKIKIFFLWKFLLITKKEVGATHQKAFKLMLLMMMMMMAIIDGDDGDDDEDTLMMRRI